MEWIQTMLDSGTTPLLTAFLLGLLTAMSPCPLATNIAAVGYIAKDVSNRNKVFAQGLLYATGRIITYSLLGVVMIFAIRRGMETFLLQKNVSDMGEIVLPVALIVIGVLMLVGDKLPRPKWLNLNISQRAERLRGLLGSLLLGVLFALAFCPTSGLFFFGMLIPMSAAESGGYGLPIVYAFATALPVVVVAWVLAYSISGLGRMYKRMKAVQQWMNTIVAILFVIIGIYYLTINYNLI